MNSAQFVLEFKLAIDKIDTDAYPDIRKDEIYYFLNEAQERFVKSRYNKNNLYQQGFEEIQKRTDDLRTLVKTGYLIPSDSDDSSIIPFSLSTIYTARDLSVVDTSSYMFFLRGQPFVVKTSCSRYARKPKLVTLDKLDRLLDDPFNNPDFDSPLVTFENGISVYKGTGYTVPYFKLTYLKRPVLITDSVTSELPEHTHKEIVQLAVAIALENIESQRLGSQLELMKTTE